MWRLVFARLFCYELMLFLYLSLSIIQVDFNLSYLTRTKYLIILPEASLPYLTLFVFFVT